MQDLQYRDVGMGMEKNMETTMSIEVWGLGLDVWVPITSAFTGNLGPVMVFVRNPLTANQPRTSLSGDLRAEETAVGKHTHGSTFTNISSDFAGFCNT